MNTLFIIFLGMDANVLMEIAKHDRSIWRLFSVICKDWSRIFNPLSYELAFREIRFSGLGYFEYRLDGLLHRTDGPAVIHGIGYDWYFKGKLHRGPSVGPARVTVYRWGKRKEWYEHGERHRIGGPAIIGSAGFVRYYEYGERILHEDNIHDGPPPQQKRGCCVVM